MFRSALPALVLASVFSASAVGCAPEEEEDASSAESAFTVERGDRFIVSATPTKVVLRKRVDNIEFPFDEKSLLGKALLVHPVAERAETGVYSRVTDVALRNGRYEVECEPLTFEEMRGIPEDDVVRIYMDPRARGVQPVSFDLKPMGTSSTTFSNPLDFTTFIGLGNPAFLKPGVTINHKVERAELRPEVLANYDGETGLEVGMRASLSWRSKLTVGGRVGGTLFKSATAQTAPYLVFVPIGWFPIPVSITASAYVTCAAVVTGPITVEVALAADASVGGSMRVNPSFQTDPRTWITEGSWPAHATGSASATPTVTTTGQGSVKCVIPRVEVKALVAGISGPYLAISPTTTMDTSGARFSAMVSGGISGELFGQGIAAEVPLFEWKP